MGDSLTPFGKKWEWFHSIWMLWLFFPLGFTSFIAFFYIGVRVKQVKWMIAGLIYLLFVVQFFIVDEFIPFEHFLYDLSVMVVLAGWIAAWVHAVSARRTYLQLLVKRIQVDAGRLSAIQDKKKQAQPVASNLAADISTIKKNADKRTVEREDEEPRVINVNTATKEEIAQIPSFGNILAKKIIDVRQRFGPFESFTHFITLMEMKPHLLAKARPYLRFSDEAVAEGQSDKTPKKSDASKYKAGRIVDY